MTNEQLITALTPENRQETLTQLYEQNCGLFKKWAKPFYSSLGEEDALQECYIALDRAVKGFDADKGYKFTTYLQNACKWHLITCCNKQNGFKLTPADLDLLKRLRKFEGESSGQLSTAETIKALKCTAKQLEKLALYFYVSTPVSLDAPINEEGDTLADFVKCEQDFTKEYESEAIARDLLQIWSEIEKYCSGRQSGILHSYFKEHKPLNSIAEEQGCSTQRIQQEKDKALQTLRQSEDFTKWVNETKDSAYIAYSYGFKAWLVNHASAVELAAELSEGLREKYERDGERIYRRYSQFKDKEAAEHLINSELETLTTYTKHLAYREKKRGAVKP